MKKDTHEFIQNYKGLGAFGMNRDTDEETIMFYLQKFSDDALMEVLVRRMTDEELCRIFDLVSELLRRHLSEPEYHRLFLKEAHHH